MTLYIHVYICTMTLTMDTVVDKNLEKNKIECPCTHEVLEYHTFSTVFNWQKNKKKFCAIYWAKCAYLYMYIMFSILIFPIEFVYLSWLNIRNKCLWFAWLDLLSSNMHILQNPWKLMNPSVCSELSRDYLFPWSRWWISTRFPLYWHKTGNYGPSIP